MKPLVSILCITYNQREFIKKAVDSFLEQKTDFPFEILIHDDASTDGTTEILQEYANDHPGIFRLFLEKENQYSKHNFQFIKDLYVAARGRYIAICEGDDFWTDPTKLQREVNFLEEHTDYALVFHPVRVFFENGKQEDSIFPSTTAGFTVNQLLQANFIQTNSVMYRARKDYKDMVHEALPGDWYAHLYHAQFGKIGFINRVMAAYRRHDGGMWWSTATDSDKTEFWNKYAAGHMTLHTELLKMYNEPEYREIIASDVEHVYRGVKGVDYEKGADNLIRTYPIAIEQLIDSLVARSDTLNAEIESQKKQMAQCQQQNIELQKQMTELQNSRSWKITKPLRLVKKRVKRLL